ncbi:alpha/beta hydrolase [Azospirillum halopraeferens]|uniref:alpha/beta hydrolase n=1 Tax=Azospirillum halopraeferens TaxID=34010 RepID=UPI0003F88483|nr:alpha/beta hydrolase [Azospirillum halopraeferens]
MIRTLGMTLLFLVAIGTALPAAAQIRLVPAYGDASLRGPARAAGVVVWSHGRSVESEDSEAPTPAYLKALGEAGWDVYRLDRMRVSDTLGNSAQALAGHAEALRARGYRRVVLTGQSFGAFISLIAAGRTDAADAVIGTAPAAYGNFTEAYDTYRENARQLWRLLRGVRSARVMLFFFHGDDFDPGGRGDVARAILVERGLHHLVVDQPAALTGHGAANTGLFVRRFAGCIVRFAEAAPRPDDPPCDAAWGRTPSDTFLQAALPGSSRAPALPDPSAGQFLGRWYGAYVNGREVLLNVERVAGNRVEAEYVLGPGIDPDQRFERVRRTGRLEDNRIVFDEPGRNVLRYRLRHDGRLAATWEDRNGPSRLDTVLRRVN